MLGKRMYIHRVILLMISANISFPIVLPKEFVWTRAGILFTNDMLVYSTILIKISE